MNKRDTVDNSIYAENLASMRVSGLKEIREGGQNVPFCMSTKREIEREVVFIYLYTKNPASMRVTAVDGFLYFIYANQKA